MKETPAGEAEETGGKSFLRRVLKMTGAPVTMLAFFLYCALEGTTGLWASSFLVLRHNIAAESAASMASLFYIGITAVAGLVFIGLGCAPVYPGLLHQTPVRFGAENAQAVMGMQMACAYVGSMTMPAFFGKLSDLLGMQIYPVILMAFAALLAFAVWNANRLTLDRK